MTNKPPFVSPAQALDLLIAQWRSQADEYERRKTEAMNQRYEPGEMINRSKMLAFRNCADELQSVLAELRLRAPSRATPESQLTPTTECPDGEKHILRCIRCEIPASRATSAPQEPQLGEQDDSSTASTHG